MDTCSAWLGKVLTKRSASAFFSFFSFFSLSCQLEPGTNCKNHRSSSCPRLASLLDLASLSAPASHKRQSFSIFGAEAWRLFDGTAPWNSLFCTLKMHQKKGWFPTSLLLMFFIFYASTLRFVSTMLSAPRGPGSHAAAGRNLFFSGAAQHGQGQEKFRLELHAGPLEHPVSLKITMISDFVNDG